MTIDRLCGVQRLVEVSSTAGGVGQSGVNLGLCIAWLDHVQ